MSHSNNLKKILIIDFDSQFTQLIARRVRELGVYSEIISHKKINKLNKIKQNTQRIVLSGGPLNVYESNKFKFDKKFMQTISNKIINNIPGINRVVYDITSKPPSTIELE